MRMLTIILQCHICILDKVADQDKENATDHFQIAAMMGEMSVLGFFLGIIEAENGNMERAKRHYIIAAKSGDNSALEELKKYLVWKTSKKSTIASGGIEKIEGCSQNI